MSMSKSEASRLAALEVRVAELEKIVRSMDGRLLEDDIGADHAEHLAAFPKKRGRPPKVAQ